VQASGKDAQVSRHAVDPRRPPRGGSQHRAVARGVVRRVTRAVCSRALCRCAPSAAAAQTRPALRAVTASGGCAAGRAPLASPARIALRVKLVFAAVLAGLAACGGLAFPPVHMRRPRRLAPAPAARRRVVVSWARQRHGIGLEARMRPWLLVCWRGRAARAAVAAAARDLGASAAPAARLVQACVTRHCASLASVALRVRRTSLCHYAAPCEVTGRMRMRAPGLPGAVPCCRRRVGGSRLRAGRGQHARGPASVAGRAARKLHDAPALAARLTRVLQVSSSISGSTLLELTAAERLRLLLRPPLLAAPLLRHGRQHTPAEARHPALAQSSLAAGGVAGHPLASQRASALCATPPLQTRLSPPKQAGLSLRRPAHLADTCSVAAQSARS